MVQKQMNKKAVAEKLLKIAKSIIAMPLIDTYKDCRIYLNGNDHRPPHLAVWYENPRQKADFVISNGNDPKYKDGELLEYGGLPKAKLKEVREWFSQENRNHRVHKIMDYIQKNGEPDWFKVSEIFTPNELAEYQNRKAEKQKKSNRLKRIISRTLKKKEQLGLDVNRPWSRENNYDVLMEILECEFNDDYTLSLLFADGTRKKFDVKDKIFNEKNREYRWFQKLQDLDEFKKGEAYGWIVIWDDERDISSYELYTKNK